jgi:hypothetical protein
MRESNEREMLQLGCNDGCKSAAGGASGDTADGFDDRGGGIPASLLRHTRYVEVMELK